MRKQLFLLVTALIAAAVALGAIACGDDEKDDNQPTSTSAYETPSADETPEANAVDVRLLEYEIVPEPASAAAGNVTFNARNVGGEEHELVIIKTDLAEGELPTSADGSVNEDGEGIEVIGEVEDIAAGDEQSASFELEAGNYVLICNIVEEAASADGTPMPTGEAIGHVHYAEGMYIGFTVE